MLKGLGQSTPFRLAVILGLAFMVSLLVAGIVALQLVQRDLSARTDQTISDTFAVIAQSFGENDITDLADTVNSHANASPDRSRVFLLKGPSGAVLAGNVGGSPLTLGWVTVASDALGLPPGSERYRVFTGNVGPYFLLVGESYAEARSIADIVTASLAWAGALFAALVIATGVLLASRAQRRLDRIAATMALIGHGDLDARIPVGNNVDDVSRLARQVNDALDRLASLVEGMRQVSVDIAHDLKTPLNRLSITLENAIATEPGDRDLTTLLLQAQDEARQINKTFDALLRIAQLESGARRSRFVVIALEPIVTAIGEVYADVAEEAGQHLTTQGQKDIFVLGDRELLVQLLANLVENAIRHCPARTDIYVTARYVGNRPVLAVSDNGPGVPENERSQIFKRLYRLEKSRTTPGTGLGLSLVKAIADLHGASIMLADNGPGLSVTLRFPPTKKDAG
jgi:signal transduction histidine kinase